MFDFLIFGTFWFWIIIFTQLIIIFSLFILDKKFFSTIFTILLLYSLHISGLKIIDYIIHHPFTTLIIGCSYFILGGINSILEWFLFMKNLRVRYDETRKKFGENHNIELSGPIPDEFKDKWRNFRLTYWQYNESKPLPSNHKSEIYGWIIFWPFSIIWRIIHDPITRILKFVYMRLLGIYESISDRYFSDIFNIKDD